MNKNQPYYVKSNIHPLQQKRINTMIYYLFPRYNMAILSPNLFMFNDHEEETLYNTGNSILTRPVLSFSLSKYMEEVNHKLKLSNQKKKVKTNCYSNIQTISKIKHVKYIFYELIELYSIMNLKWENYSKMNSVHFGKDVNTTIKMCQYIRKDDQVNDEFYSVYTKNYSLKVLDYYYQEKPNMMDLLICDSSSELEDQNAMTLILQLCIGLCCQKHKGTCIVKYGDTFSLLSLDIIAFLSHFYEKTFVLKPSICDLSTGEKYIVCKNFIYNGLSTKIYENIRQLFIHVSTSKVNLRRLIRLPIPLFISSKLEEINSIFGQSRLEHIQYLLINKDKDKDKTGGNHDDHTQKCKDWCYKYNIPVLCQ